MARTRPRPPSPRQPVAETDPPETGGKGIMWAVYAFLAMIAFCFGVWAGNQKPKTVEVVRTVTEKAPEPKKEPEAAPTPPRKDKEPPAAVTPKTPEPKTPEPKMPETTTPEPKPPEPKTPAPKPPEPKPPEPKSPEPKTPVKMVSFEKEILPIFRSKCLNCHGAVGKPKGDLDLRTLEAIAKGGETGVALKPGDLTNSLIWATIADMAMPPPGKEQLTEAEQTLIKNWILSGGK